jgi:16S rRNA (adenine1518-N6/adenine1519-N6)-dimethyltransferase
MPSHRLGKRRSLGQHYLIDPAVTETMVRLAAITQRDRVLEIGTGRGALTRRLAGSSHQIEAFELDRDNYAATQALRLGGVTLHHGDAFSAPREFDILVSSLPYSESSNFVEWLGSHSYERAVVLLQRDFVDKLLAAPGDERYRAISVISQISSEVRRELEVTRESFDPPPKVSSTVVVITPRRVLVKEEAALVKLLFSQRRRKLAGALRQLGLKAPLEPSLLEMRVQDTSPAAFLDLLGRTKRDV